MNEIYAFAHKGRNYEVTKAESGWQIRSGKGVVVSKWAPLPSTTTVTEDPQLVNAVSVSLPVGTFVASQVQ